MALRGTLKDFALPDIFQLIGMQRKTGVLTLESDRETVTVVFENGMVVHADSSVRRLDDLLGNVLVRRGKLAKEALEEALAKQKVSMQRLGYVLTHHGYIEPEALRDALSEQVQQIVFRIFRWKSGQYDFDPSSSVDYDRGNITPVSTDHILMEGIRRVDEWPIIEKRIPSLQVVFRPLVPHHQIRVTQEGAGDIVSLESAMEDLERELLRRGGTAPSDEVVLTEAEARVYRLLDGRRTVAAVIDLTGMSDFDVCRTLFDFIERSLVASVGQKQTTVTRVGARPVAPSAPPIGVPLLVGVVVLSAAGFFFSQASPFRLPGASSLGADESGGFERSVSLARMQRLDTAIRAYYLAYGEYPASLDDLVNISPPLVTASALRDGRDHRFRYERTPERVSLHAVTDEGEPYLTIEHEILPIVEPTELVDLPHP
ncbi:MAG: DUF4388 domain-containing protein [Acidobacteriota bacterium]